MTSLFEVDAASRLTAPTGTKPFRDAHLEEILHLHQIDAEYADNIRRWLRVALTHSVHAPANHDRHTDTQAGILHLFRRAGETAIETNVRSWLLKNQLEIENDELERGARRLIYVVCEAIPDELRLKENAQFPVWESSQANGNGSRNRALKYVALQVLGMLSVLALQQSLREIIESAINAASTFIYAHASSGELAGITERPMFPQQVIANADDLARKFGLPYGNTMFRKSLVQPARLRRGKRPYRRISPTPHSLTSVPS